jgi:hypothetical protein
MLRGCSHTRGESNQHYLKGLPLQVLYGMHGYLLWHLSRLGIQTGHYTHTAAASHIPVAQLSTSGSSEHHRKIPGH